MKGSSFGAIYDAFDGFERQMEDALDGIFNEDVTPGITDVAVSVTQLFQSIIGCDNTRIFMDNKKRKSGLSFVDKNVIAEPLGRWTVSSIQDITLESNAHNTTALRPLFIIQHVFALRT